MRPSGSPGIDLVGFEHESSRLRILVDSISSANFDEPIAYRALIIQVDPASVDCNDERDTVNWSSRMSFSRVKYGLGLFPIAQFATSGYDECVNSVE